MNSGGLQTAYTTLKIMNKSTVTHFSEAYEPVEFGRAGRLSRQSGGGREGRTEDR